MTEIIIENAVQIVTTLAITMIGVFGTWLSAKLAKKTELTNISNATNEAVRAAQLTVLELQQTVVDAWKAAHEDRKLTEDEVQELGMLLVNKTMAKMSDAAKNLLTAAGVDLTAMIIGAGEAMIQSMKK